MVEYEFEPYGSGRYRFDRSRVRLDLYRLLNPIFASGEWHHVEHAHSERLGHLAAEFEQAEIEHGLINVAIATRMLLDSESPRRDVGDAPCGELIKDLSNPRAVQILCLREACNKIIHAESRNYDVDHWNIATRLEPHFHLYGRRFKIEWKASLDLVAFAKHVADLTDAVESV